MATVQPFSIDIQEVKLARLYAKLDLADYPDELDGASWDYGSPLSEVRRLGAYWRESYDWRRVEANINRTLKQFTAPVDVDGFGTLQLHFVYHQSPVKTAIPLLFIHGWPGSFLEVSKIIAELTEPTDGKAPAFHVIAPSLPGFTFSEATKKRGFGLRQYAEACHKIVLLLGYVEYVTQGGGDWGVHISRTLASNYRNHVKATHINMIPARSPKFFSHTRLWLQHAFTRYTPEVKQGLVRARLFAREGLGYSLQQKTRPQTLGYGLTDSPVGLLAWILDKLHEFTDDYAWTDDELLTWISLYYFSRSGPTASLRIYYEFMHDPLPVSKEALYFPSPLGLSYFPQDVTGLCPLTWGRTLGNVVFENTHKDGGHLAAWERPHGLVADLRTMFGKSGGAADVVHGMNGYR